MEAWLHFVGRSDSSFRSEVLIALESAGFKITSLDRGSPSGFGLLFLDDMSAHACDLVREASHGGLERLLVVATSSEAAANPDAWGLLEAGASDLIVWNGSHPAREALSRFERWREVDDLVASPIVRGNLVGESPPWIRAMRQVVEAARFTDASVLILGESGTGKELVALHLFASRILDVVLILHFRPP